MASVKGKIVTISSFKGGVGKTMTLLNIASKLAKNGKKVLLLDLDFESSNLSLILNTRMNKNIYTVVDDLRNNRFKDYKDYIEKCDDNIDIVNSIKDPRQGFQIEMRYIEMFLNHASFKYDIILIDTTHGFGTITVSALDCSDKNIFVMSNDILDIKSTKTGLAIMTDANKNNYILLLNEGLTPYKKYFNVVDIENIIKKKIDYKISRKYYINNVNKYILNGEILEIYKKNDIKDKVFDEIAKNLFKEMR